LIKQLVALVNIITQTAHLSKCFAEYAGSMQPSRAMKVYGTREFNYSYSKHLQKYFG